MNRSAVAIIAFALAGSLAAAGESCAQARPGGSQGSSSGATHLPNTRPVQDPKNADAPVSLRAQVQVTLGRTADELRINASQEKAWNAYATQVIRLADDISRARFAMRDAQSEGITAPQLFDRIAETAQNRMTAVEEIVDAGRALYATLSPTQQRLADRQLAVVVLSLASGIAPAPGARNDDGSPIESKPRP
ncbi:MAG: Spy/CpxP family protein refolding chaperone [Casimicrobiaceae bacterium]